MYLNDCITQEQVVNIINNEDLYSGDLESHEIAGLYAAEAVQGITTEEAKEIDMAPEEYNLYCLESHLLCLIDAGADFEWTEAMSFGTIKLSEMN